MSIWNKKKAKKERSLRKQVEALKRAKLASGKVVKLSDFRELRENSRPETILVVDDDEVIRNGLTRILEGEGYQVIVAEDGMELSKVLETVAMDLILLDVNLPWVDGFELCTLIKGHDLFKKLPLILISASKTEEDLEKGFAAGCDEYLGKPFDVSSLIDTIDKSLVR
jgi:CheY-like chemotaxis protein